MYPDCLNAHSLSPSCSFPFMPKIPVFPDGYSSFGHASYRISDAGSHCAAVKARRWPPNRRSFFYRRVKTTAPEGQAQRHLVSTRCNIQKTARITAAQLLQPSRQLLTIVAHLGVRLLYSYASFTHGAEGGKKTCLYGILSRSLPPSSSFSSLSSIPSLSFLCVPSLSRVFLSQIQLESLGSAVSSLTVPRVELGRQTDSGAYSGLIITLPVIAYLHAL